jgi:uncharacterized repeat protein (TIGR03899 family)
MKIGDLAGLSKPLTRLIDVISQGIGAVATPYLIRKTAEAKAHEINVIANALKEVGERNKLPVVYDAGAIEVWQKPEDGTLILNAVSADHRVASRLEFQQRKRQKNIERVTSNAATELADETGVPEERPDDDWVTRFFDSAQDIRSTQMQELWGRILAGEIKKPGSYSLRTLEFVKNLTKQEAEVLEKLGRFALSIGSTSVVAAQDKDWLRDKRGVYPSHQFTLGELGLMYPSDLGYQAFNRPELEKEAMFSDDFLLLIRRGGVKSAIHLPIWKFTTVGKELLSLVNKPVDEEYLDSIARFFVQWKAEVTLCRITEHHENSSVSYQEEKRLGESSDAGSAPAFQ